MVHYWQQHSHGTPTVIARHYEDNGKGNTFCKEEQTEHAKEMLLEALNIRCAPDVDHEDMSMVRDYIREGLNNLLNMTSVLPIKDLGWTSWIIYPEKFTYAKCVTCEDLKGGTTKKCKVYGKQYSSKEAKNFAQAAKHDTNPFPLLERACVTQAREDRTAANRDICVHYLGEDLMCNTPLNGQALTYSECCCHFGTGLGPECRTFPPHNSGKDNRFCWLRHLLCVKGKRLHKAYVLLPLQEGKLQPDSVIHLQTLGSSRKSLLESEQSQSIFGSECGLRFDMTQFIMVTENLVEICVEPLLNGHPAFSSVMDGLKCQPFLGTIWKKQHHSIQ
ncbi:LTBP3 protein, partial [Polypterus senegalus]|nr:LTBP3 protein [Polypterus senegalus]